MPNQFPSTPSHRSHQPTLKQAIRAKWQAIAAFMVHRPQPSAPTPTADAAQRYGAKANAYPYLPAVEEQRDWLERIYSDRHIGEDKGAF
ncbi:MAG: hypothetical protein WBA10_02205 [Elainellaceae cyanobacterium]